ncbi:histamine H2 receptor-like [Oryctolagus cuniculus]|uniref:histamine H2 receptor-like n=1 Tax=Oryctolagus cuniculus TaxID=9986 RepID=UPI0004903C6C|nr:histamine H2 receptor-like [Oryctolagus cuniculus]
MGTFRSRVMQAGPRPGGSAVLCLAVGLNRHLRSLTNCFIVSLAITDLLLGLPVLPFLAIYQLSCRWSFGKVFCNIYISLDVMLCTASILNLFMISIDRYCAVTDPLRYPVLVTPGRVTISLVSIWVISITLSFLSIHLGWNSRNTTSEGHHTSPKCKFQVNEVYGLVDGLVTFYLPLLIMCVTYYRIFKIAREQARRINHISSWQAATIREHKEGHRQHLWEPMTPGPSQFTLTRIPRLRTGAHHVLTAQRVCGSEHAARVSFPTIL